MVKRLIDAQASDFNNLTSYEKLESIKMSEGRVLMCENIGSFQPILGDISNAELATAFGADILLFNMYDCEKNEIQGIKSNSPLKKVKELTNRLIGVNLEPVYQINNEDDLWSMTRGRMASIENVEKLIKQGVDIIVLTGNPCTGVTNDEIFNSIKSIKAKFGDKIIIISGKMHSSGISNEVGSELINEDILESFINAGTDIVLLPAPGTIPGFDIEKVKKFMDILHKYGKMGITAIGTSQEGSDIDTIKQIALNAKMTGADLHHLGDSGLSPGLANPENIMAYSIAIKGKRHTFRRMSRRNY